MTERISCCNPKCKRTASVERHPGSSEIICSKCWKLLPKALTARYRALRRRDTKALRLATKKERAGGLTDKQINECDRLAEILLRRNWLQIRNYFRETEKPQGLESFLSEVGL